MLEAAAGDIEFRAGRFVVAGTDRAIGFMELAAKLRAGMAVPEGLPKTLDVTHVTEVIPSAFPNGCHVAEVEIDPETGIVEVVRYSSVNDFGTIVNPLLVEGQVHGGVVQGIGQAFMEDGDYDETGQLLTGSFMDYALPRAGRRRRTRSASQSHAVPATTNPLGAKGCGEAGCAGALPLGDERGGRCAVAERGDPPLRHAGEPAARVAGAAGGQTLELCAGCQGVRRSRSREDFLALRLKPRRPSAKPCYPRAAVRPTTLETRR